MKKAIIALILILALVLCGCGDSSGPDSKEHEIPIPSVGRSAEQWAVYEISDYLSEDGKNALYESSEFLFEDGQIEKTDEFLRSFKVSVVRYHNRTEIYELYLVVIEYHGDAYNITEDNISRIDHYKIISEEYN